MHVSVAILAQVPLPQSPSPPRLLGSLPRTAQELGLPSTSPIRIFATHGTRTGSAKVYTNTFLDYIIEFQSITRNKYYIFLEYIIEFHSIKRNKTINTPLVYIELFANKFKHK